MWAGWAGMARGAGVRDGAWLPVLRGAHQCCLRGGGQCGTNRQLSPRDYAWGVVMLQDEVVAGRWVAHVRSRGLAGGRRWMEMLHGYLRPAAAARMTRSAGEREG